MTIYPKELSRKYSESRNNFTATDKKVFSLLQDIRIRDKDILDFGCGDGVYSFKMAELGANKVIGIDVSHSMIEIANNKLQNKKTEKVNFIKAGGDNLPFEDNRFDIVFCNFVLHHFKNTLNPLREIYRVLNNNGYLIGTFNTAIVDDAKIFNTEIPLRLGKEIFVVVHNFIKSDEEIQQSFLKAGLKILRYEEEKNPFLSIEPSHRNKDKIKKIKTIVCLAQK